MGMEVFHWRNGNSGSSVVVSIGAHNHPGKRSWSGKVAFLHEKNLICTTCTMLGVQVAMILVTGAPLSKVTESMSKTKP